MFCPRDWSRQDKLHTCKLNAIKSYITNHIAPVILLCGDLWSRSIISSVSGFTEWEKKKMEVFKFPRKKSLKLNWLIKERWGLINPDNKTTWQKIRCVKWLHVPFIVQNNSYIAKYTVYCILLYTQSLIYLKLRKFENIWKQEVEEVVGHFQTSSVAGLNILKISTLREHPQVHLKHSCSY